MAEGKDTFAFKDQGLDNNLDNDDDYEQEVNRTGAFEPTTASTPYNGREKIEMQTMQHEQSGLPDTSYEETPLLGAQAQAQRSWDSLTRFFPDASSIDLETTYSKTGRLQVKMAGFGKKAYELFTKDRSGRQKINPKFTKEIIKSLGQPAEQIIEEDRNTAVQQRQRLEEAEKQQSEAEKLAEEREKEAQEIQVLEGKIERTNANIDAIQETHGTNLESEAELRRLKQLKKNHQTELENKKKELAVLEKKAKNEKKKSQEKVDQERKKLYEIERKKIQCKKDLTKPSDLMNLMKRIGPSSMTLTHQKLTKKLQKKELKRDFKEKIPCLLEKEFARSSKNMA